MKENGLLEIIAAHRTVEDLDKILIWYGGQCAALKRTGRDRIAPTL